MSLHLPIDTVAVVVEALAARLDDTPVVTRRPDVASGPRRFVRVVATGGRGRHDRMLHTAQVTVDSYAPTAAQAMELALTVDATVHMLPETDVPVAHIEASSAPTNLPDQQAGAQRCTATYQITTRTR